jgi:hypothetical protein
MANVINLLVTKGELTAVRQSFSNLKKAVEMCKMIGLVDSYMIVYRDMERWGEFTWFENGYKYSLSKNKVE